MVLFFWHISNSVTKEHFFPELCEKIRCNTPVTDVDPLQHININKMADCENFSFPGLRDLQGMILRLRSKPQIEVTLFYDTPRFLYKSFKFLVVLRSNSRDFNFLNDASRQHSIFEQNHITVTCTLNK